jgi:hypothetical protein
MERSVSHSSGKLKRNFSWNFALAGTSSKLIPSTWTFFAS